MTIIEELGEINPKAMIPIGLEEAVVGYSDQVGEETRAVVSIDKCLDILVKDQGMTREEAVEYFTFNTSGAYMGEHGPVYVYLKEGL